MLFSVIALTACSNEAELLQEQINALEEANAEMQSTISSLRGELELSQGELSRTRNELQQILDEIEEEEQQAIAAATPSGPLAITFYGTAHTDRQWPLRDGVLEDIVGLYVDWNQFDDDVEIYWRSTDDGVFTVVESEDGMSATVTPVATGVADIVVTVGDQEARATIRII